MLLLDDGVAVAGALEEAAEAADGAGVVELALHDDGRFGGGFVVCQARLHGGGVGCVEVVEGGVAGYQLRGVEVPALVETFGQGQQDFVAVLLPGGDDGLALRSHRQDLCGAVYDLNVRAGEGH